MHTRRVALGTDRRQLGHLRSTPFRFEGGARGDKVQVTWADSRGDGRTDEATIG